MRVKVNPWDMGVKPHISKGSNGKYSCLGGGVRAFGWDARSAYLFWQKGRVFNLNRLNATQPTTNYRRWIADQPFFKTI